MLAKAVWEVRAGLVPGTPVPELTKRWVYTYEDREKDATEGQATYGEGTAMGLAYQPNFLRMRAEAMEYHARMSYPKSPNWAELTFIWY